MVDFVGFSSNPKTFKRNQYSISQKMAPLAPKFRSEQEREIMKTGEILKVFLINLARRGILEYIN
jgi:hypothetical protein